MFVVRGTQKLLDRTRTSISGSEPATTTLGDWYATVLSWRPQVALLVNEPTRLPVLVPLAPAKSLIERFVGELATVFALVGADAAFINAEVAEMSEHQWAKTTNRSVVGTMTEFGFLARHFRDTDHTDDLLSLTLRLAHTPCGPLRRSERFPDAELRTLASRIGAISGCTQDASETPRPREARNPKARDNRSAR